MNDLIVYIARALVDEADKVVVQGAVNEETGRQAVVLQVAPDDRGKVIGKKGRMAHTMRILLNAAAGSEGPVSLDIVD